MMMTIKFSDILNRATMLSSYEGGRAVSEAGGSLYSLVHITSTDEPLIRQYADMAFNEVTSELAYAIEDTSATATYYSITFVTDNLVLPKQQPIEDTMASIVMREWLSNKVGERSEAYKQIAVNCMNGTKAVIRRKKAKKIDENY